MLNEAIEIKNTLWTKEFSKLIKIKSINQLYPYGCRVNLLIHTKKVEYSDNLVIRSKFKIPIDPVLFWNYADKIRDDIV